MLNFKKWLNEAGGDNPMAEPPQQQIIGMAKINPGGFATGRITDPNSEETEEDKPPAPKKHGSDRFRMKKKMKK